MYSSLTTRSCLGCCRLLLRAQSSSSDTDYRKRADYNSNPYKELYSRGKKPTSYRERYIENIKNAPRHKIGVGNYKTDLVHMRSTVKDRKHVFYKSNTRTTFAKLGLLPDLCHQIAELGVVYPSYHQSDVIPVLLEGRNCVYVSPTGSGKTYTFLLPTLQLLLNSNKEGYITRARAPRIIIMSSTKELSLQTGTVTKHLIQELDLNAVCLTEHNKHVQQELLNSPTDILIGTYHDIETLTKSGSIATTDLQHLIIDEVDNFLDYRVVEEREEMLKALVIPEEVKSQCQIIMTSAILSYEIFQRLGKIIPNLKQYLNPRSHTPLKHVDQKFWFVRNKCKPEHFVGWLRGHCEEHSMSTHRPLIFCNFSNTAYWLHKFLISNGINNIYVSTQLTPKERVRLMLNEIPNTTYPIVTTDAFSSGLDFREFGLVVNYEFPFTYEDYLRRMGRTGRMSTNATDCLAVSYVSHKRNKDLYNTIRDSTDTNTCKAYTLSGTSKYGWLKY